MKDNKAVSGGRRNRWPLGLDPADPEGLAGFLLGLGYDAENVTRALTRDCKQLDQLTARRIVEDVARTTQPQGGQR